MSWELFWQLMILIAWSCFWVGAIATAMKRKGEGNDV